MIHLTSSLFFLGALALFARSSRGPSLNVAAIVALTIGFFYGLRSLLLALGLDTPFPDYLHNGRRSEPAIATNLLLALFVTLLAGSYRIGRLSGLKFNRYGVPAFGEQPDWRRLHQLSWILLALSALLGAWLLTRFGSPSDAMWAAKQDKQLAGLMWPRTIPSMAALCWTAIALRPGLRLSRRLTALSMAMMAAGITFLWGTRIVIVMTVFTFLVGLVTLDRRPVPIRRRPHNWRRLVLMLPLVLLLAYGLRISRDMMIHDEVRGAVAEASLVRSVTVATNATQYDALILAVRDWPTVQEFRGGAEFTAGFAGVVPRLLWPDKPTQIVPGSWFRQVYEPNHINGWPMGAVGEWYLNFGVAGVIIGALLSGFFIAAVDRTIGTAAGNPLRLVTVIAIGVQVVNGGVNVQTPMRLIMWCLPLAAIAAWTMPRQRRASANTARYGSAQNAVGGPSLVDAAARRQELVPVDRLTTDPALRGHSEPQPEGEAGDRQ
jgi:oligosaccharide repeat unit polymerase